MLFLQKNLRWLWLLLLVGLVGPALAQPGKPKPKRNPNAATGGRQSDFFRIKTPKMRYVRPDTTTVIETEELPGDNSDAAKSIYFNPKRELSIVSEDTATLDEGGQQLVEMSEEVLIDSSWVKVAGYYTVWDTHRVNPYQVDGRDLRDTLELPLTEPERERFAKMPLVSTPITSGFAFRGYRWHYGVDLDLETGDPVLAAFDGVVRISQWDGMGYGNYLLIRHYNGLGNALWPLEQGAGRAGNLRQGRAGDWARRQHRAQQRLAPAL